MYHSFVRAGHRVVATTRSVEKQTILRGLGAIAVVVDAVNSAALETAVRSTAPTHVIQRLKPMFPSYHESWLQALQKAA